ncbi:MAG: alpha/beta hydrolase [Acutalibacteraceae bacterium]
MKRLVIYIHGKGGSAQEAEHYRPFFAGSDVVGFDYKAQNPWEAEREFSKFYDLYSKGYDAVFLVANSIGAYFSMHALAGKGIAGALFISPIVDMEKLIEDMMLWSNVTEAELCARKEIPTAFGETLSWAYLCYVREHPIAWDVPTGILYGAKDNLTSKETVSTFAQRIGAPLTVMEDGEHWFHTDEQMRFLDSWIEKSIRSDFGFSIGLFLED